MLTPKLYQSSSFIQPALQDCHYSIHNDSLHSQTETPMYHFGANIGKLIGTVDEFGNETAYSYPLDRMANAIVNWFKPTVEQELEKPSEAENLIEQKRLDIEDRPDNIKESMVSTFENVLKKESHLWGCCSGMENYELGGIYNQYDLLKDIILNNPDRKEFYILDIGAGGFQWGHDKIKLLNADVDISEDVIVNVISIRGEKNSNTESYRDGKSRVYDYGAFMIENLSDEFQKRGLELEGKVDLIVSSWTFKHLIDPLGTFVQAYNLLRPQTGYYLSDMIFFAFEHQEKSEKIDFVKNLEMLLLETKSPFLMWNDSFENFSPDRKELRYYFEFILKRNEFEPFFPQLQYSAAKYQEESLSAFRKIYKESYQFPLFFKDLAPSREYEVVAVEKGKYYSLSGDEALYQSLVNKKILTFSYQGINKDNIALKSTYRTVHKK